MNHTYNIDNEAFKKYLLHNKSNRIALIVAAISIVVQFAVFKYFYPFASYIHGDSFSYLNAAYQNLDINTYMIGYSRFLRFFSVFTASDTVLTAFQYLVIQAGALFLLITIFYFYQPGKITKGILYCFVVYNPLFLHMANMISSDCLFLALSLTWLSLLLWVIHQPASKLIVYHTLVLGIVFTLRYNALIFPAIATLVFLLSPMSRIKKVVGITAMVLLCGSFVGYTTYKYYKETSYVQYSPFSGWQWANNAMYVYRYVDSAERKPVPKRFEELDNMIRQYFDSTRDIKKYPHEALEASTVYMWSPNLPLYKYRNKLFRRTDSTAGEFKRWASMGPLYGDYGRYIIKQYPLYFIRHFVWPNGKKYYAPPVEFLEKYNSGKSYVMPVAKNWFNYKSQKVFTRTNTPVVHILDYYPILTGTANIVFLATLLCFIILRGFKQGTAFSKGMILITIIWLINAGFTILASSAALRFQSFPVILITIFALLLVDWMVRFKPTESTVPTVLPIQS